jgi:hypothetical protein
MTMRKTPFERIRYPWTDDVVNPVDIQSMASDIDSTLVQTARMGSEFSQAGSVVAKRAAAQSITKATLTAVTFDSAPLNNGANSPLSNGVWWKAAAPTRLTAPVGCIVLASGAAGINYGAAVGTSAVLQVSVRMTGVNQQGNKYSPTAAVAGQQWTSGLGLWKMAAGDYLELMIFWIATGAGPYNTDTVIPPQLSVTMVGLTSVP